MRTRTFGDKTYQGTFEGVVQEYIHLGLRFPVSLLDNGASYFLEGAIRIYVTRELVRGNRLLHQLLNREPRRCLAANRPPMARRKRVAGRREREPNPRLAEPRGRAMLFCRRGRPGGGHHSSDQALTTVAPTVVMNARAPSAEPWTERWSERLTTKIP